MQAYLNPEQNEQLEMAATYLRDRLLIRLLRQSGCRISEALGLSTEDIDLVKGEMIILHLKTRVKMLCPDCQARLGRSHSFCPGCGRKVEDAQKQELQCHKQRILPLDNRTLELLREFIERGGADHQHRKSIAELVERLRTLRPLGAGQARVASVKTHQAQMAVAVTQKLCEPRASGRAHVKSGHLVIPHTNHADRGLRG